MKVLSTDGLTELIQLTKNNFISNSDTVQTTIGTLATVATTGSYNDLSNKPTIPDTSNLANKDLSNLSSTGNSKFQAPLVSGTNIKTINGSSILGSGDITIQSAPDIDNKTITTNTSDELQTVGVIDSNNTTNAIKTWTGTKAQYDAIVTKDATTLYNITDDTDITLPLLELLFPVGAVYFGTMSVCPLQVLGVGTWQQVTDNFIVRELVERKEATSSDSNWYNLYSDGWCEQGGCIASPSNGNNNVTFLKAFNNNNYYFNRINYSTTNGTATNFACEGYSNKTNSSITIYLLTAYASTIYWQACGYTSAIVSIPSYNKWERIS